MSNQVNRAEAVVVTIRPATRDDAAALAALAERTFREAFEGANNASDMEAHCRRSYSPAQQLQEIEDPTIDTIVVAGPSGDLVGYAMVRAGEAPAAVQGPAPVVEIWRIYVDRGYHGRGVAHALMAACLEAARVRGGATVWLGVWEHNPRAQAFYRKMGFTDAGAHRFVLGNDRQTDRVMVRAL